MVCSVNLLVSFHQRPPTTPAGCWLISGRQSPRQLRKIGTAYLYSEIDVSEYALARERTRLARALGWKVPGMVRHDEWDFDCPICGALAIGKPGATVKEHIELLGYENRPWLCVNGHTQEDTPPAG